VSGSAPAPKPCRHRWPALAVTRREALFEEQYRDAEESLEIVVVLNWLTELRARMAG
jgi:hypothetical protein